MKKKKENRVKKRRIANFVNRKVNHLKKYKKDQTEVYNRQKEYFASDDTNEYRVNQQYQRDQQFLKSIFNIKVIAVIVGLILLYLLLRRY